MAYTDEQRQALLTQGWHFPSTGMRAKLVSLGILDGKTFALAVTYADAYGAAFAAKDELTRSRIEELVRTGTGGILDALLTGTPKLHTLLTKEFLTPRQWPICLYLLGNGDTLANAIAGDHGVYSDSKDKMELVLYFLYCGKALAEAKTAAGVS